MNRQEALEYGKSLGIKPSTYGEQCVMVDTILAIKQFEQCANCKFKLEDCNKSDMWIECRCPNSPMNYNSLTDGGTFLISFGCSEFQQLK